MGGLWNIANKKKLSVKVWQTGEGAMAKAYPNIVCVFATVSMSKLRHPSWR